MRVFVTRRIHVFVTCLIHMGDVIDSYIVLVYRIYGIFHPRICDMSHSHESRHLLVTYGVATVSRIDRITGLF